MSTVAKIVAASLDDKPARKRKTSYNAADILDELAFHNLTKTVQLMGQTAMVIQGYAKRCNVITALPLDDLSFMKTAQWDKRKKCFMYSNIELGDMRPRPEIITTHRGVKCQIRQSYLSDCKIRNVNP